MIEAWVFYLLTVTIQFQGGATAQAEQSRPYPDFIACEAARLDVIAKYPEVQTLQCRRVDSGRRSQ